MTSTNPAARTLAAFAFVSAVLLAPAGQPAFGQLVSEPGLRGEASRGTVQPVRLSTQAVLSWPDPAPATSSTHQKTYPAGPVSQSTSPLVVADPATGTLLAGPAPAAPAIGASWPGIGPNNGSPPPDPTLAVGLNHVVAAVNDDFAVFNKAGANLAQIDFNTWFESNDRFFDPKCAYDHLAQRYLCVVLRRRDSEQRSWWSLMASDDNDPVGIWYTYNLDATLDGNTPNGLWADYPFIGYDQSAIYLTANMASWPPGAAIQYAKLRIVDKSKVYNGLATGWWDFWNFQSGAASCTGDDLRDRSLAPAQTMDTGAPAEYVLSTKGCGGNALTLRRITQPLNWVGGPTLTTEVVPVGAYALPPAIQQPQINGQPVTLNQMPNYLTDKVILRSGHLYASHTAGFTWSGDPGPRAVLKLYDLIPTAVPAVVHRQSQFGHPGRDYYLPSVAPTASQDMVVGFGRSSDVNGEFPGLRYTVWPAGGGLLGSRNVKMGTGSYTNKSWGDYFSVQPDPADPDNVWFVGEYSQGGTNWGTWVAEIQVP